MIDIKWLLYRYDAIKQARDTAQNLLTVVKNVKPDYDPNFWIRGMGGLPNSRTENEYFSKTEDMDKMDQLYEYIRKLDIILSAIDSAVKSLKKEFHDLITLRYIEDVDVYEVAHKLNLYTPKKELNMRKYYREHNIALEGMNIGCMPLNFLFTQDEIELIIGRLIVRKSVTYMSQNRVVNRGRTDNIVS